MINKTEVVAYVDLLRGQERRYVSLRGDVDQHSLNDGDALIRLSDYEALLNKFEKLQADYEEELSRVRQDLDTHFGMLVGAVKQVVDLQDERESLRKASSELANWCVHEVGVDIEVTPGLKQIMDITGDIKCLKNGQISS